MNQINTLNLNQGTYTSKSENTKYQSIAFLLTPKITIEYLYDTSTVRQALEKMRYHGYTAMPILTIDGYYIGTLNEGDFLWHILDGTSLDIKEYENQILSELYRKGWNPPVKIDTPLENLLLQLMDQNFVPVVDDRNMFMGIITRKSILQYYHENR